MMSETTLTQLGQALAAHHLTLQGGTHDALPEGIRTAYLIGPAEPGFWLHLKASPEWQSGAPDPIDRWSARVLTGIAGDIGAIALFPFGGAPWHPFYQWATSSHQTWESPVRLLVGSHAGLFVSFRGALGFSLHLPLPTSSQRPCDNCKTQPCTTACPAGALNETGYNLARCHAFLDTKAGADCMNFGCAVRRACPVSQSYARLSEQSAYHMRQFHK
jgi:hypothetical protein